MRCPSCNSHQSGTAGAILETRYSSCGKSVRRRRQCQCGHRFTTREYTVKHLDQMLELKSTILSGELENRVLFMIEDLNMVAENASKLKELMSCQIKKAKDTLYEPLD
jgi:transcriptional regulator NrdR family protein